MSGDVLVITIDFLKGLVSSAVFILVIFIGFCVLFGFTKLKKTSGHNLVVKSLDEAIEHKPVEYMPANTPRGVVDQLGGARA